MCFSPGRPRYKWRLLLPRCRTSLTISRWQTTTRISRWTGLSSKNRCRKPIASWKWSWSFRYWKNLIFSYPNYVIIKVETYYVFALKFLLTKSQLNRFTKLYSNYDCFHYSAEIQVWKKIRFWRHCWLGGNWGKIIEILYTRTKKGATDIWRHAFRGGCQVFLYNSAYKH